MEVNVNEGGVTHTRGGKQWFILPAGCTFSSHFTFLLLTAGSHMSLSNILHHDLDRE